MLTDKRLRKLWDAHLTMSHEDRLEDHLPLLRHVEREARREERERCAKVCDMLERALDDSRWPYSPEACAEKIRALPEE